MTPKSTDPWLAPAFAQFETELERFLAKPIPDIEFEGGWEPNYLHVKDKVDSHWGPEQMTELLKASGYVIADGTPPSKPKPVSGKKAVLTFHGKPLPIVEFDGNHDYIPVDAKPIDWSTAPAKDKDFPHECPKCKGPAYIGFSKVECKRSCK